jgi:class 3 adenylate cyclase
VAGRLADSPGARSLPTGTVTFLFTDIEGSTKLVQALGDQYRDVLSTHCRILRSAIEQAGGTEVSTEGDSFFAVFPTAAAGLAATATAQREFAAAAWPAGTHVRMGLPRAKGRSGGGLHRP